MSQLAPATADTPTSEPVNDLDAMDAMIEAEMDEVIGSDSKQSTPNLEEKAKEETQDIEDTSETAPSDEANAPKSDETEDTDGLDDAGDDTGDDSQTLEAPARWDADGREIFAKMPPEAQEYVLNREKQLQAYTTQQNQEAAQLRLQIHELQTQPDTELNQLIERQSARLTQYADVTPEALLNAVSEGRITAEQAQQLSYAKQQEEAQLREMQEHASKREQEQWEAHTQRETLKLQAEHPELANKEAVSKVMDYLKQNGVEQEQLRWIDAKSVILADKARKFDELQAARATSKPAPVKAGKPVRSTSSQEQNSRANQIARLRKSTKPKDIERLMDLQADAELDAFGW